MTNRGGVAMPMHREHWILVWMVLSMGSMAGCNSTAPLSADTGAREVAQGYCEAIHRQDWARAYATLDPDSRARCNPEMFARLAQRYRRDLGFEPEPVRVRFCQEQGTRAVVHIVWKGQQASRERFYKDSVVLRQTQQGWGVVLPRSFGGGRL